MCTEHTWQPARTRAQVYTLHQHSVLPQHQLGQDSSSPPHSPSKENKIKLYSKWNSSLCTCVCECGGALRVSTGRFMTWGRTRARHWYQREGSLCVCARPVRVTGRGGQDGLGCHGAALGQPELGHPVLRSRPRMPSLLPSGMLLIGSRWSLGAGPPGLGGLVGLHTHTNTQASTPSTRCHTQTQTHPLTNANTPTNTPSRTLAH